MATDIINHPAPGNALIAERLTEAREAKGLTMAELAERIGVTRQAVSQFEGRMRQPDPITMMAIMRELDQPISFFICERPPGGEGTPAVFFRSFKSKTKTANRAFNVWRRWVGQIARYMGEFLELPPVKFLELDELQDEYDDERIEEIATACRRYWGLGDGPIGNMTALLESKGCIVTLSELGVANVDAFSCWQDGRPFIFLGSDKGSACRSRFDAAHELGHLIMHRGISEVELEDAELLDLIEREANRFASSFLLPQRTFPSEIFSHRIAHFVELKPRWKVSVRAMAYRCNQLGLFDDDRMLNFWKQMSASGYTKWEPLDDKIPFEYPELLKKSAQLLFDNEVKSPSDVLAELRLSATCLSKACRLDEAAFDLPESRPISLELALKKGSPTQAA